MAARNSRGSKKGKAPAKRKAPQVSPPRVEHSSDEEEELMPDFEAMIRKLSKLERERLMARSLGEQLSPEDRRLAREKRIAERDKLGEELRAKIVAMESDRSAGGTPSAPKDTENRPGTSIAPTAPRAGSSRGAGGTPLDLSSLTPTPAPVDLILPGPSHIGTRPWSAVGGAGELCTTPTLPPPRQWPWGPRGGGFSCTCGRADTYGPLPTWGRGTSAPVAHGRAPQDPIDLSQAAQGEQPDKGQPGEAKGKQSAPESQNAPPPAKSVSFGCHISKELREKIVQGQYLDIFSLLNRKISKSDYDKFDERHNEAIRRKKPERTWANWLPAFYAYAGILAGAKPELGAALFKYADTIYRAYVDFAGTAWLRYDEQYREKMAEDSSLTWDGTDQTMWLQTMAPARPVMGSRFDSGHLIQKSSPTPAARVGAGSFVRQACWEYNNKGACNKKTCRFKHICAVCAAAHASINCPKGKGAGGKDQPGGRKTPAGNGANPKGPQSN